MKPEKLLLGIMTYGGFGLIAWQTNLIVCIGVLFVVLGFVAHYHFNVRGES